MLTALNQKVAALAQGARRQCRRVPLAGFKHRQSSTSSSSIFPIRRTTRSASSTPPPSSGALAQHLSAQGLIVVQSTSPMFARKSFWCIVETIKQAGYRPFPIMSTCRRSASGDSSWPPRRIPPPTSLPAGLRFVCRRRLPDLFDFPPDMARVPMPANHLNDQVLVRTLDRNGGTSAIEATRAASFCVVRRGARRAFDQRRSSARRRFRQR